VVCETGRFAAGGGKVPNCLKGLMELVVIERTASFCAPRNCWEVLLHRMCQSKHTIDRFNREPREGVLKDHAPLCRSFRSWR
jgi:hypothetical protein